MAFTADSKRIALATRAEEIEIWDIANRTITQKISDWANLLAFSANGEYITDGSRVWEVSSGKMIKQSALPPSSKEGKRVWFTPDGSRVVMMDDTSDLLFVWDARTGETIAGRDKVLAVSVDAKLFIQFDRQPRITNVETGEIVATSDEYDFVKCASFSPDGKNLIVGYMDGTALVYDTKSGNAVTASPLSHPARLIHVAFSPDGSLAMTESGDGNIRVWDTSDWRSLLVVKGSNAVFSPDNKLLSLRRDDKVLVWEIRKPEVLTLNDHSSPIIDLSFSPDGNLLATVGLYLNRDNRVLVWESTTGRKIADLTHTIDKKRAELTSQAKLASNKKFNDLVAQLSPKGRQYAETDSRPRKDSKLEDRVREALNVNNIQFSTDGKRLIAKGKQSSFRWDVNTWQLDLFEMQEPAASEPYQQKLSVLPPPQSILSPDGKLEVTVIIDVLERRARVWELNSRREITDLPVDTLFRGGTLTEGEAMSSQPILRFSGNGKLLAITDNRGGIHIYPWEMFAPSEDVADLVRKRVNLIWTEGEARKYLSK